MGKGSLEVKVGIFLLAALVVVVGFVFILGRFDFSTGHLLLVDFRNSGGLREGARVKIAGVGAGKVREIAFLGGSVVDEQGEPIFVRVKIEITPEMAVTVTEGSSIFVSTEGILGERYLEIQPGPVDGKPIPSGSIVAGKPTMELQTLAGNAASMVERVQQVLEGEEGRLRSVGDRLDELLERSRGVATTLDQRLPGLLDEGAKTMVRLQESLDRLDGIVEEGRALLADEAGLPSLLASSASAAATLDQRLPALLDQAQELASEGQLLLASTTSAVEELNHSLQLITGDSRRLMARAGATFDRFDLAQLAGELRTALTAPLEKLDRAFAQVDTLLAEARTMLKNGSTLLDGMAKGKGTLGALLSDRELYDDLRELLLDLKRNPWKAVRKP